MTRRQGLCSIPVILALGVATASAGDLVGKPAPDFELQGLDGKTYKLADYKGKIVVLEWANKDCPVWRSLMDELKQTHDKYASTDASKGDAAKPEIVWLAIDSTNMMDPGDVREFCEAHKIGRPILDDREGKVGKSFKARTTPHMFIIDTKGTVVYDGAIDNKKSGADRVNYVSKALDELLAGKEVSEAKTRPYGCGVKYKR